MANALGFVSDRDRHDDDGLVWKVMMAAACMVVLIQIQESRETEGYWEKEKVYSG